MKIACLPLIPIILAALLVGSPLVSAQDFDKVMHALDRGDYVEASRELRPFGATG